MSGLADRRAPVSARTGARPSFRAATRLSRPGGAAQCEVFSAEVKCRASHDTYLFLFLLPDLEVNGGSMPFVVCFCFGLQNSSAHANTARHTWCPVGYLHAQEWFYFPGPERVGRALLETLKV